MVNQSFNLDPRTKLSLLLTVSTVLSFGGQSSLINGTKLILVLLPIFLFIVMHRFKTALMYMGIYVLFALLNSYIAPMLTGLPSMLFVLCGVVLGRLLPSLLTASYIFSTTTVADFITAMEKLRIPAFIVLPLAVVFRLFPSIGEENKAIKEAMKIRAIKPAGVQWINYHLLPLMTCIIRIGDELSASALTRGLGSPVKRESIKPLHFRLADYCLLIFCGVSLLICFFQEF